MSEMLIDISKMTEDQIIAMADRIKAKRKVLAIKDTFLAKTTVTIRWDIPNVQAQAVGASYYGIEVPMMLVKEIVENHFDKLINPTEEERNN
jgi:hypothetical protein